MTSLTLRDLGPDLARCALPPEQAASLPPACYASAAVAAEETERLFGQGWIGVGRADRLRAPGAYAALEVAGRSVLLLRGRDGRLRAFANSCRHRGARLMDGEGTCRGVRCPFHSWAYRLDGALAAAPRMDGAPGFDRAAYGLSPYAAEERLGFVFLSLAPDPPDLDAALGDFAAVHAPWPLESLVTSRRRTLEVDCNWKAFLEVFNEHYHLPFVHPSSIDALYRPPEPGDRVRGGFASQFGRTEGSGGLLQDEQAARLPRMPGLAAREAEGVRYTWVFPNMTFALGAEALWLYEAYPLGADRCAVAQTLCFPPETAAAADFAAKAAAYHRRVDAALAEDVPALVNQQRGLRSPDARPGRFQPLLEANVAAFARWYAARAGCAPGAAISAEFGHL